MVLIDTFSLGASGAVEDIPNVGFWVCCFFLRSTIGIFRSQCNYFSGFAFKIKAQIRK